MSTIGLSSFKTCTCNLTTKLALKHKPLVVIGIVVKVCIVTCIILLKKCIVYRVSYDTLQIITHTHTHICIYAMLKKKKNSIPFLVLYKSIRYPKVWSKKYRKIIYISFESPKTSLTFNIFLYQFSIINIINSIAIIILKSQ